MLLNLSFNAIEIIVPAPAAKIFVPPFIHVMDASFNRLARIPKSFLEQVAPALRRLDLSHNRITDVANTDLKALLNLQELRLADNTIIDLQKQALRPLTGLQILDLSQNRIEVLQFGQFAGLTGLRIVNLAHNRYTINHDSEDSQRGQKKNFPLKAAVFAARHLPRDHCRHGQFVL